MGWTDAEERGDPSFVVAHLPQNSTLKHTFRSTSKICNTILLNFNLGIVTTIVSYVILEQL